MAINEKQCEFLKNMSAEQKLDISMDMYYSARQLKAAWLKQQHNNWPEEKIEQAVREAFANARS